MSRSLAIDPHTLAQLDKLIHEPARLSVMACLALVEEVDFVFLQSQTGMTGGNLSTHIKKLEQAGYLTIQKAFVGARPRTTLQITDAGRDAFERYTQSMNTILKVLIDAQNDT